MYIPSLPEVNSSGREGRRKEDFFEENFFL